MFDFDDLYEMMEDMGFDPDDMDFDDFDEMMGTTNCPEGCYVDPDGRCPHGFESWGLRMGFI